MSEVEAGTRVRALLLGAAAVLLLSGLGARDLWAPDEPRYGQIAEEMRSLRHGPRGLVVLHLNGEAYTQKPPLYYWLAALAGSAVGRVSEAAARLPSALAGLATIALVLRFGSRLFGKAAGSCAAGLLLTVYPFVQLARRAQLDVVLTLFETAALLGFWNLDRGVGRPRCQVALLHGAMGLAVLTKGPVGFLLPALVIAVYLAIERCPGTLRRAFPLWGLLLSVGPGLVWLLAASAWAPSGFVGEALGENLFGRFFLGTSHARPVHYYLYHLPLDFLPWTLLWPLAFLTARRRVFAAPGDPERARAWRFLLSWAAVFLVFFSLSAGKRSLYLLPAFPAVALLCGDAVVDWLAGRRTVPPALGRAAAAGAVALLALGAVILAAPSGLAVEDLRPFADWVPPALGVAWLATAAGGFAAWRFSSRRGASPLSHFAVVIATLWAFYLATFALALPALDAEKSPRPLARAAAALSSEGRPIGVFDHRSMVGGLAYYGERPVALLSSAESVERFFAEGGRAIVVKANRLERLARIAPVQVRESFRTGRRRVLVVSPGP